MSDKVIALARPQDYEMIQPTIFADLVNGHVTYFSVTFRDATGWSSCFFAPVTQDKDDKAMMFVGDYEKVVRILLSHPKIRHVEYAPEWRVIQAIFDDPYLPRGDQDVIVRETLKLEARDRQGDSKRSGR